MSIVLANGCFDPLHYGHILHLRAAARMGRHLVVALTTDEALSREKGLGRPFYPWAHRAAILRELRCVSEVIPSSSGADAIRSANPDIFVKGIDYVEKGVSHEVREICEALGVRIAYTDTEKLSATAIARRIVEAAA